MVGEGVSDPQGLSYERLAQDYERGRAGWPPAMIDGIEGEVVLDLAAGTGKLTRVLVERFETVIAVEPLTGMRDVLARLVPGADALPGSAERIPLDDASVDAVFVAEAFHWFDSAAAVREIARVLRSGGTVLVCFNHWLSRLQPPIGDVAEAAIEARWLRLPAPGGPKVASGAWKDGFADAPFTPLDERTFDHEWVARRVDVAAYYVSTSSMGALPEGEREELRRELLDALADVEYRLPMQARAFTAVRT